MGFPAPPLLRPDRFNGHSLPKLKNVSAMRLGILFVLIASMLAPAGADAVTRRASSSPKPTAVLQLMQSCDAHKFETIVHVVVDGEPRDSKVKLCGIEGQSDADWINTLRDAIRKLQANKEMAPATRNQIVSAINAEIERLSIVGSGPIPVLTTKRSPAPEAPLSRDYSALPLLPAPPEATAAPAQKEVTQLPPPRETRARPIQKDFAQLPPVAAATVQAPALTASRPEPIAAVAPRLSFGCDTPGDLTSDAPCADFERETVLTVHARDDIPAGTLLQFVRNDRAQAELPLDGLRRGGALRAALPREVCSGFTNGKLELRIVRGEAGAEVLSTDGPYSLRC